jgi:hypothetical protein
MRFLASVLLTAAIASCTTDDTGGFHASLASGTIELIGDKIKTIQLDVALEGDPVVGSPIYFADNDLEINTTFETKIADLRLTLGHQTWSSEHVVLTDAGTYARPLLDQCGRTLDFGSCLSVTLANSDFDGGCYVLGSVEVTCD